MGSRKATAAGGQYPRLFRVDSPDALLALAKRWQGTVPCGLYVWEGGYELVLYPTSPLSLFQRGLLEEYACPRGRGALPLAWVKEHAIFIGAGFLPDQMITAPAPDG